MISSYWYEHSVFYGIDIRRFQDSNGDGFGDIRGLISRLDYLTEFGINALWLLPFMDTPLQDNGYDIRDYFHVDPRVGTLEDFVDLVEEAHKRKIHLVIDLVMNHTSDQHPWFQASRHDPASRFRNYYVWTETPPDEPAGGGPIFPGEEDSVWTYDPVAKSNYFHRFYHFQPDLRIANPAVQDEIYKVIDFWLSLGVDGFRLDAAPIMVEAKGLEGTEPEKPHRFFEEIHHYVVPRKPDAVILGEANVQLDLMDEFFGGGTEMNMLFNFLLGPHILLAFARGNAVPIANYLRDLLNPPANDQWLNFLRNFDEMSLEKMPKEQTEVIFDTFAPEETMRIYGRGIRRRITPMLSDGKGMNREKVELAFSLLFSAPGTPLIMFGDEIGMGDDLSLPGRNSVRTPMQWTNEKNGGFSTADSLIAPVISEGPYGYERVNVVNQQADPDSFYNCIKNLIDARIKHPVIGLCPVQILETEEKDERVLAHFYDLKEDGQETAPLLFFHNLSTETLSATIHLKEISARSPEIRTGKGKVTQAVDDTISVELPGFGYLWLQI